MDTNPSFTEVSENCSECNKRVLFWQLAVSPVSFISNILQSEKIHHLAENKKKIAQRISHFSLFQAKLHKKIRASFPSAILKWTSNVNKTARRYEREGLPNCAISFPLTGRCVACVRREHVLFSDRIVMFSLADGGHVRRIYNTNSLANWPDGLLGKFVPRIVIENFNDWFTVFLNLQGMGKSLNMVDPLLGRRQWPRVIYMDFVLIWRFLGLALLT